MLSAVDAVPALGTPGGGWPRSMFGRRAWAGLCPGNHESAGKRPSGCARKGDTALRTAMVEAAWAATRARTTYLGAQYQRFR